MDNLKLLIDKKDINGIREYLSSGININDITIHSYSPLAYSMFRFSSFDPLQILMTLQNPLRNPNNNGDEINLLLIEAGADVNYVTKQGMSLLLVALDTNRSYELICRLIKGGCSVNYTYRDKNALHFAIAKNCDKRIISKLIYEGANVNQCGPCSEAPLFYAVKNNDLEVVQWLVDAGGNVNARGFNRKNLLMVVSCKNCYKNNCKSNLLIDFLMKQHVDIKAIDSNRNNIIHWVDCKYLIDLAVKHGVSIDKRNTLELTPLLVALTYRNSDKANYLLKFKPDVNYCTSYQTTALCCAVKNNSCIDIRNLVNAGADVNAVSLLTFVECKYCSANDCPSKLMIDLLICFGINLKYTDIDSNSLLHLVNCHYLIYLTIKHGVSVNCRNNIGYTPLMSTVVNGEKRKAKFLLSNGADFNCLNFMLEKGLHLDYNTITAVLLYYGADIYSRIDENKSVLDDALSKGFQKELINASADTILQHCLLYIDKNHFDIHANSSDEFKSTLNECKNELQKMQELSITRCKPSLTFYEFCLSSKLLKDKLIDISFSDYAYDYEEIKNLFPRYSDFIITRVGYNQAKKTRKMMISFLERVILKPSHSTGTTMCGKLQFDCLYYVGCYLNRLELFNLLLASSP